MIPLAVLGVIVLMACIKNGYVANPFPLDYQNPVVPANNQGPGGDAAGASAPAGAVVPLWQGFPPVGSTEDPNIIGDAHLADDPPAYVDPARPVVNPDIDDAPPQFVSDPWALDASVALPPVPPSNFSEPVKSDPVVAITPPYFDPTIPVPTDAEVQAAQQNTADTNYPVPTPETDPGLFIAPQVFDVPAPESPMDNWTAENTEDTECDDDGSVEVMLA